MMLDHLGETEAASAIENSVMWATGSKIKSLAAGHMGYSTTGVGDLIVDKLKGKA